MYKKSQKLKLIAQNLRKGKLLHQSIIDAGIKSPVTVLNWRNEDPRIEKFIKRQESLCETKRIGMVTDANFKSACEGNVAAQCFFLKNKAGWKDVSHEVNVSTFIISEQLAERLKKARTSIACLKTTPK